MKLSPSPKAYMVFLVVMTIIILTVICYFIGRHSCQTQLSTAPPGTSQTNITPTLLQAHSGRLPRHIQPILYNIELFPRMYSDDPAKFTFTGRMWLRFRCLATSSNITLNVNSLTLHNISVDPMNSTDSQSRRTVKSYNIDKKWQVLEIHVTVPFINGSEYWVQIIYSGDLQSDFSGLYLSKFHSKENNRYVAASQFSPTDARKAFPCLDEPDRKAQFDITLVRRSDMMSISNMPRLREEVRDGGYMADIYERTPRMSTYLVAMVVGDFSSLTIAARPGLNYTSWAWTESINNTRRGLEFGAQVLSVFEEYFGTTFPLPKQDMLAVPETAVGAMENWGLIIFRQERIFYNTEQYSDQALLMSSITISHELAHQWFGNLVTMSWWSELMLKEGFAVYLAEVGIDKVHPDWHVLDQFGVRIMHPVFETDWLESSHPVYMKLADTTQIRQIFDSISYSKSGCLIRMLHFFLGDDVFHTGLKTYLNRHQYGTAGLADLWSALEAYSETGVNVPDVMNTWTLQENYPLVTISQIKPGYLHITQAVFLNSNNVTKQGRGSGIWKIPFTFTSSVENNFTLDRSRIIWLESSDMVVIDRELPDLRSRGNWVVGNMKQMGYYRVNYDTYIWKNIIDVLKHNCALIHTVNRAQVINDLFALSKAKLVPVQTALSGLEYLQYEYEYVPWKAALKERVYMERLVKHMPLFSKYKAVWGNLVDGPLLQLELDRNGTNMSMSKLLLYSELFAVGSKYGIQRCVNKSKYDFEQFKDKAIEHLEPNTREATLCSVLQAGSSVDWTLVLWQYNITTNLDEKHAYLYALTCTNNTNLHDALIALTEDTYTMTGVESVMALTLLAANSAALHKVWLHVTQRWDYFLTKFSGSLFQLASLVTGITSEFNTGAQLNDLETFIKNTSNLGPAAQAFSQAVEKTKEKVAWITDNMVTLEQWLDQLLLSYTP